MSWKQITPTQYEQVINNHIRTEFGKCPFSSVLKTLRQRKSFGQTELSTIIGFDRRSIRWWESGLRQPCLMAIHRLSLALEVSPNILLGWPNNKPSWRQSGA
jgi:transcriptional regulator with XRE-family HTH domain